MPYRVMVVEDSQALNELLCEALSQAGYMVTGFLDAESVLEFSGLRDIDIAVLDIQLPGESGLALSGRLQTLIVVVLLPRETGGLITKGLCRNRVLAMRSLSN